MGGIGKSKARKVVDFVWFVMIQGRESLRSCWGLTVQSFLSKGKVMPNRTWGIKFVNQSFYSLHRGHSSVHLGAALGPRLHVPESTIFCCFFSTDEENKAQNSWASSSSHRDLRIQRWASSQHSHRRTHSLGSLRKDQSGAGAHGANCLPSVKKALGLLPAAHEPSVVALEK